MTRSTMALLVVALALVGCGESKPAEVGPRVGTRYIVGRDADVWVSVLAMRESSREADAEVASSAHPEQTACESTDRATRLGMVEEGDLVEIIERGEDESGEWVALNLIRTRFGEPGRLFGYARPLWRSR